MKVLRFLLQTLKILLMLAGVVFVVLFLRYHAERPKLVVSPYQTAAVTRGTFENTVSSTGTLAAVETVDVGTQVSGTIVKIAADYNDHVKKGQVLAIINQDLFKAAVNNAQGAVTKALATLALDEKELERNRPLYEKGYLSQQEFLPYETNVKVDKATLASARASLAQARTNLANTVIRSPIDGTVIQRSVDTGQTVAASFNTPTLFVIAEDLSRMQIEANVDETDIGQIRQGQHVRFTVQAYPDKTFTGTVSQIRLQPQTISNVVTYTVIVKADNDRGLLLPGMTATADFVVEHDTAVLLVPNAALRFQPPAATAGKNDRKSPASKVQGKKHVFVLGAADRLQPVTVETGSDNGQVTVVTGGDLRAGMRVVIGTRPADQTKQSGGFFLFGHHGGGQR
ncbi:MAG TPA: efflux RND transporter periplasmic adaptor subunit [Desulfuromonadales bacterium]|nr:efflux RND transporter periplasmic adaptor subunit [Desulfuromonadales bacterium]